LIPTVNAWGQSCIGVLFTKIHEYTIDPRSTPGHARSKNINRKLLTPSVLDTVIRRINDHDITNSKDIRKLRVILRDPVAKDKFLSQDGSIDSALQRVPPAPGKKRGLVGDLEELGETLKRYPWTSIRSLKGDADVIRKLEETEKLLKELKRALVK